MSDLTYYQQKLNEMPKDFLKGAVQHIQSILTEDDKAEIREAIAENGLHEWAISHHFFWGMAIRNELRQAGFLDESLPDGNWDDYYVSVVEIAVGKRIYDFS